MLARAAFTTVRRAAPASSLLTAPVRMMTVEDGPLGRRERAMEKQFFNKEDEKLLRHLLSKMKTQADKVDTDKNVVSEEKTKLEAIVGKYHVTPADVDAFGMLGYVHKSELLEEHVNRLEEDLKHEKRESQLLRARLDTELARGTALETDLREKTARIAHLEQALRDKDAQILALQATVRALQGALQTTQGDLLTTQGDLLTARGRLDTLEARLAFRDWAGAAEWRMLRAVTGGDRRLLRTRQVSSLMDLEETREDPPFPDAVPRLDVLLGASAPDLPEILARWAERTNRVAHPGAHVLTEGEFNAMAAAAGVTRADAAAIWQANARVDAGAL